MTACPIRSHWKLAPLAVGILLMNAWAQTSQPALEIPAPTIRVTTHMVLVDVVVTDKQGKAITGLHPDDFVVDENGKSQKISSLATPADNAPVAAPDLPRGIYSNKPQYRSSGAPITVMLLDALNTPFSDQAYARRQMLAFVKEQFKPSDRMSVFTLTGPLNVLQDFTGDSQVLYTALAHYRPQTQPLTSSTQPATSAEAGPATPGSTVASLDASSLPPSDSIGSGGGALRGGGGGSAGAKCAAQSWVVTF